MHFRLNKTLAVLMVCTTAISLLLTIFFLIQIWRYRQPATFKLQSYFKETANFLSTTDDGLEIIDQVVLNTYSSTLYLDESAQTLVRTIQDTNLLLDSAGTFLGENLITTITNTQSALVTAKSSAVVIDNIMNTLSHIPLIGITYNPSLPLNVALGQVADSLGPIQGSLKNFQANLETTGKNIQEFKDQLMVLDQNIISINKNLASSRDVIENYRSQVKDLISSADLIRSNLARTLTMTAWILTVIIVWLALIQLSILLQGIHLLTSPPSNSNPESQPL